MKTEIKNKLIRISILKNGKGIRRFTCHNETMAKNYWNYAIDLAGGMWNGKDKFEVVSNEL
jgi:hypothetical protein